MLKTFKLNLFLSNSLIKRKTFFTTEHAAQLFISDNCVKRLLAISAKKEKAINLRLQVDSGGCSGFKYTFLLDSDKTSDDM